MSARVLSWQGCGCSQGRRLLWLVLLAAALTCVPYLVAWLFTPPGYLFSGFLLDSWDCETYLFKIRLGEMGLWWQNWYSPRPGAPARLFWPYIALGKLGSLLGVPGIAMFHAGRLAADVLLALGLCVLAQELRITPWWVPLAGLFWCGSEVLAESPPVPEMRAGWAALTLPHFALSQAVACWCLAFWLRACRGQAKWAAAAAVACTLLGSVHPYMVALPVGACAADAVWRIRVRLETWKGVAFRWVAVAFGGVAGSGWAAWEILRHPWVMEWLARSKTAPLDLLTLAILVAVDVVLCTAGAREWLRSGREDARVLVAAWSGLTGLLYAVPVVPGLEFRKRYLEGLAPVLGLFVPMGMAVAVKKSRAMAVLLVAAVLVGPVVCCARPLVLQTSNPVSYYPQELDAAFRWLSEAARGSLVLSDPVTSNRIPSRALCRTVAGHWAESPGFADLAPVMAQFFSGEDRELQEAVLERFRPEYVLWRRDLFPGAGLEALPGLVPVWEGSRVVVFARQGG